MFGSFEYSGIAKKSWEILGTINLITLSRLTLKFSLQIEIAQATDNEIHTKKRLLLTSFISECITTNLSTQFFLELSKTAY